MIGKKKKAKKGVSILWDVHFDTTDGGWPVTVRAFSRTEAVKSARDYLRKYHGNLKIIKFLEARKV
jgi:hypothetical protein